MFVYYYGSFNYCISEIGGATQLVTKSYLIKDAQIFRENNGGISRWFEPKGHQSRRSSTYTRNFPSFSSRYADLGHVTAGHSTHAGKCIIIVFLCLFYIWNNRSSIVGRPT